MPLENLLAKATFSRSKETVQYQRIDEARSLLNEGMFSIKKTLTIAGTDQTFVIFDLAKNGLY